MLSTLLFPLSLLLLFSSSNAAMDPKSLYHSFLQCIPSQSPQPARNLSAIVYSTAANSTAYTAVLQAYIRNSRFNSTKTPKPAIIITPTTESQVQAAILCAKKARVQIKVRSGGHDYEGISSTSSEPDFMILDMSNFRSIDVNIAAKTAVVGAGALLGELYFRISEKSKVHGFPSGVCPTIGVGGHFSSGGYGSMLRKFGLAVDHVTDAKMVDANGRVLDRKSMGEDLFWAIRGGGGGSFGVILSYTIKLVPVPEVNTVFTILKTVAQNATELVFKWQTVATKIDNDLFVRVLLQPVTVDKQIVGRATFMAHFLGDSNRLVDLMKKNFPELGLKKDDCTQVSWIQSMLYWANFQLNTTKPDALLDRSSGKVNFGKRKSDYIQTPIPVAGVKSIFEKLVKLGKVGLVFNPYGGKMSEIAADATPFPHRAGNLFKMQYSIGWNEPDPAVEADSMNQAKAMHEFMTPFVSKNPRRAFLNYRDLDIGPGYGDSYFVGNLKRLVTIKTKVDPNNFFRNEQSIPTLAGKRSGKSRKMKMHISS